MYCSYTHFRVEKWWAVPLFQWHAFRSVNQVNSTKGLVKMEVWPSDLRNYHTLTTWMEKKDMRIYSTIFPKRIQLFGVKDFGIIKKLLCPSLEI